MAGALEQITVRHPDELAAVYRDHSDLVYRRCYATLGDHEAALDATQDVFLSALDNFEAMRGDVLRGLLDLARTISYERKRRPTREVPHAEPPLPPARGDDPAEIAERHGVLDAVWSGLSPVERRYVADKFAGFSFEEIARRNRRALGTVSSNLARAREHARRMREPMLPGALALAWRAAAELAHRARTAAHNASTALATQPAQGLALSLTLAGLVVGAASPSALRSLGSAPGAPQATLSTAALTPLLGPTLLDGPVPAGAATSSGATAYTATETGAAPPRRASGPAPLPVVGGSPDAETPEDTTIVAATPSPHYDDDHTIVALGRGHACGCPVVMLSSDGGATWAFHNGPPSGNEVVLPPDFPRDPAIFVGYQPGSPGTLDYVADRFGSSFAPLPLPRGVVALSAGFDNGDRRVFSSSTTGVWSYDLRTRIVRAVVVDPRESSTPSVATPMGAPEAGVYAITTSTAFTPGGTHLPAGAAPTTLWTCPPDMACTARAQLDIEPGAFLVMSPGFGHDRTVGAYTGDTLLISQDGGASFQPVPRPGDDLPTAFFTMGPSRTAAPELWLVQQTGATTFRVELAEAGSGAWHEADGGDPVLTAGGGRLVAIAPGRAMFLSAGGGFACTGDDGATWSARCPRA